MWTDSCRALNCDWYWKKIQCGLRSPGDTSSFNFVLTRWSPVSGWQPQPSLLLHQSKTQTEKIPRAAAVKKRNSCWPQEEYKHLESGKGPEDLETWSQTGWFQVASKYFQSLVLQNYRTHCFPHSLIHYQIASVRLLLLLLIG